MLKGVTSVEPGYSGGSTGSPQAAPTYEEVSGGGTGHAEVVKIEYDPAQVKYRTLLTIFFASHDSTTLNRQGSDVGTQYRSVVFYTTEKQRGETLKFIEELNASSEEGSPVVTEVEELDKFYPAENYHKDYYAKNKNQSYCQVIIAPKLQKVQKEFAELLK